MTEILRLIKTIIFTTLFSGIFLAVSISTFAENIIAACISMFGFFVVSITTIYLFTVIKEDLEDLSTNGNTDERLKHIYKY